MLLQKDVLKSTNRLAINRSQANLGFTKTHTGEKMGTSPQQGLIDNSIIELLKALPPILWFLFILVFFALFYRQIRDELFPKISGIKALGVEFSFVESSIDAAIELGQKSPQWQIKVPEKDKSSALQRAKRNLPIFDNVRILWVDDHPANNRNERRMFWQLKTWVDIATDSSTAMDMLDRDIYDLIISDIARDDKADKNGLDFLNMVHKKGIETPCIFYVGLMEPGKGVPEHAFGITTRPDQLLNLAIDALERKRS